MIKIIREKHHRVPLGDLKEGDKFTFSDSRSMMKVLRKGVRTVKCRDINFKDPGKGSNKCYGRKQMVIPCGPNGELPDGEPLYNSIKYVEENGLYTLCEVFFDEWLLQNAENTFSYNVPVDDLVIRPMAGKFILCTVWSSEKGIHWAPLRGFK